MPELDRHRLVLFTTAVVSILWIVLDQATKIAAVRAFEGRMPQDVGPLVLRVIRNSGGAFSLPIRLPWLYVAVAVIVTVLVVRALPETRSLGLAAAYGLVVGGALGNAADRIFRDGAVVDMIDLDFPPLQDFPVFNVADIGITVGAAMVFVLVVLEDRRRAAEQVVLEPLDDDERSDRAAQEAHVDGQRLPPGAVPVPPVGDVVRSTGKAEVPPPPGS